jgi:hypothetical protein
MIRSYLEERVRATALGREMEAVDWLGLDVELTLRVLLWLVEFVADSACCPAARAFPA